MHLLEMKMSANDTIPYSTSLALSIARSHHWCLYKISSSAVVETFIIFPPNYFEPNRFCFIYARPHFCMVFHIN